MIESFKSRRWMGRITAAGAALALAAGLAGCGGGDRDEPFKPTRMINFGDEYSVVENNGTRYTVNYLVTAGTTPGYRCARNPIWTQYLAAHYGLTSPNCVDAGVTPTSLMRAAAQAKVAQVSSQIDSFISSEGGFREGDVVTVLAGANDIRAAYLLYPATPLATLRATVTAAGQALGAKTKTITAGKARVLLVTVPDLGLTPYAIAQNGSATDADEFQSLDCSSDPGTNRQKVLSVLTACFNNGLRTTIENDGNKLGLVTADQLVRLIAKEPSDYSLTNAVDPLCKSSVTFYPTNTCRIEFSDDNSTVISTTYDQLNTTDPANVASYWLWAGDLWFSPIGNSKLGSAAISRTQTNWE
jgi:outer membrane lipase/esterase